MRRPGLVRLALFASAIGFVPRSQEARELDEIEWLDDYHVALEQAKKTQKPIFLEFRCEP